MKQDSTGIVIDTFEPEAIADAIISILENTNNTEGYVVNLLECARNKYHWNRVAEKTAILYDQCQNETIK